MQPDIITFFNDLKPVRDTLQRYFETDQNQIWLHLTTFYSRWAGLSPKNQKGKRQDLLCEFRKQSYFVGDNKLKKIAGQPVRSLVLDRNKLPKEIKKFFLSNPRKSQKCNCNMDVLLCQGCRCGGI